MKSIENFPQWKTKLNKLRIFLTHLYDIRYRDILNLLKNWESLQEFGMVYEGLIVRQLKKFYPNIKFHTCSFSQPFAIGMEVREFNHL